MSEQVNILLVDDEQRNLDALEVILEDQGYRLLRADDADKALKHLLENDVAAIVLDIKMPGVSGFELAQLIKGTKRFRQIPIVFLTAYLVDDLDVLAGYTAGAVDYLTKPINPQILRHKIEVFAELFRKTRALAELNDTLEARVEERTAKLAASEAALRAAAQQKDEFLATLAHELRNPLAPLRTGLDLLLSTTEQPPHVAKTMGAMNRQLDHMVRLIDDLLDVSRISRGMVDLRREQTDLRTIISAAVEASLSFLDKRQQRVVVDADLSLFADADPTRLSQIVANLLHNASKYTVKGGEIRIELVSTGSSAEIRVIDTGVGIPADQIDRVFDMFARIERSMPHSTTGLGIGLSLSRRLAELHGGTLSAASKGEGHGSTFTLELPVLASAPAQEAVTVVTMRNIGVRKLSVVVVEDNEDAADMLAAWLEAMGHEVAVARTGPDGVALVLEVQPDVVLCDVGLPGMDGIEVCKQIKGRNSTAPPVMVALTGWGMDADRQRTGDAGFDHHLVKPVALNKLRDILAALPVS